MNIRSTETPWIKASRSGTQGECVELRRRAGAVEVRDSKDPHGPVLRFRRCAVAAWFDGAGKAEFDHLTRP